MSKKKTRRWLSLLLAVVMLLSMLPAAAFAVGSSGALARSSSGDDFMRIVHLDAGRKYFSVQSVKALIDAMDEAGYTHLELAFGNDGLRFLLDDMSIDLSGTEANGLLARSNTYDLGDDTTTRPGDDGTAGEGDDSVDGDTTPPTEEVVPPVEETIPEEEPLPIEPIVEEPDQETYFSDDDVTAAIQAGNAAYQGNDGSAWTEDEMSEIISYAGEHGIEIIPLLNTPGHMDAILDAMAVLGIENAAYQSSERTIDVTNKTAVAFTQALVQKYVGYFASRSCTYFNMGADEYANDILTDSGMGFGQLIRDGEYGYFVEYVNGLAEMIVGSGMIPMAFNDGIYYDENTEYGGFNENIVIAYWSSGWDGYNVASASYLANMGHKLINTHGDFYYILGVNDQWDTKGIEKAQEWSNTSFMGSTIDNPAGGMFCIWCDYPDAEDEDKIYENVVDSGILSAMAEAMGATAEIPEDVTVTDSNNTGVSVTAPGLTGVTVSEVSNPDVTIPGVSAEDIVAYDIIPMTDSGNYTGEATVSIPVSAEWTNVCGGVLASDNGVQQLGIEGKLENGTFTFTVPHFSTVVVYDAGEIVERTISVVAGGTETDTIEGVNLSGTKPMIGDSSVITNVTVTGNDATEGGTSYEEANVTCNDLINGNSNNSWRTTGYYYLADDGNYYPLYARRSSSWEWFYTEYTYTWGYSTTDSSRDVTRITSQSERNTNATPSITVYTQSTVEAVPASTTVTFTAAPDAAGQTTQVTIGNVRYTINVVAEDLSQVDPLTVEFWITNSTVTADGSTEMQISAEDVYSEDGVEISTLVPQTGIRTGTDNEVTYWKTTRLDAGHQQIVDGDDRTLQGTDFTHIRYWNEAWQYSDDGSAWTNVVNGDQIVAYYLQVTDVTTEITTNVVDWGQTYYEWRYTNDNRWFWDGYVENGSKYVFLDFAVVYEDNTQNPSSFPVNNTMFFHFDGNSASNPRVLGAISFTENEDFEIWKVTVQDGTSSGYRSPESFEATYSGEEVTVWDESMGGTPHIDELRYYANRAGKLVRVYVRAKVTEDALTVHYIDRTASNEFYNYNISVISGTTFDPGFAMVDNYTDIAYALTNNTVVNSRGVRQTVTADLTQMTEIGAQYRGRTYTLVQVTRSDDGKDVYLYYTFDDASNFVIDFGLPLEIKASDLGVTDTGATITDVIESSQYRPDYGTVKVQDGKLTYTPTEALLGSEQLAVTVTYSGGSTIQHYINIYPASNVLYEDTFLSENTTTGTNYASWTHTPGDAAVQEVNNESLYGYDAQYASSTGNSLGSAWTISGLTQGSGSKYLTTEFYGNGFDLIGTAGPNTGYVYLLLQGEENKLIVIDTSYTGTYGTLSQVPLAHVELDEGEYTANIRAAYRAPSTTEADTSDATAYARSASGVLNSADVYADIAEMQADGFVIDDVEYVSVADTLAAASTDSSLKPVSSGLVSRAYTGARQAGTTVTIDGFRVYRNAVNSDFDAVYDLADENVFTYVNILDAVLTGQSSASFSSIAYVEGGTEGDYTQATYEANGGPQNELYLQPSAAVVIGITEDAYAQVSARAVSGNATMTIAVDNGEPKDVPLNTNTEMYYAAPESDSNAAGVIVVKNTGDTLVALGNLKVLNGETRSITESDLQVANVILRSLNASAPVEPEDPDVTDPDEPDVEEPETPVFTPDKLDVKANSVKVLFNKLVTVTVNASTDVDKLTVNGKTVQPANSLLVKLGLSKDYTYVFMDTVNRNVSKSYEVIAYNADGVASEVHTVQG